MRFPNVNVNRKNVEGTKIYYWIRKEKTIIVDYGYPDGDIHIYKHSKSTNSQNLRNILEELLNNDDIVSGGSLEIKELKDNDALYTKIFSPRY